MAQKPSIPQGTRDFLPQTMAKRNYIFNTIKEVYSLYGYEQIETPALENLSTLMGKYGEEGDKLLYKILNSGDFISKVPAEELANASSSKLTSRICKRGLRYDLTVPFARFVVQNQNDIYFPFKRYQIQPVWRADNPQNGRYREFYQCDADVVGSDSLLNEVELLEIIDTVFTKFGTKVCIKLNNRKLLAGIAEYIGEADRITDITVAIDKLDKIGLEKVNQELEDKGLLKESIEKLQPVLSLEGSNSEKLNKLKLILQSSEIGSAGIVELETIFEYIAGFDFKNEIELDLTLARGLNYYTGAIIEVKSLEVEIGSICGGGRYDNLTGIFGMKGMSGVGISFGADRIFDVLEKIEKFPTEAINSTQVLFINFGENETKYCLPIVNKMRKAGIKTEMYPGKAKMKKQMTYGNGKNIPFVVLAGDNEIAEKKITLKNMTTGEQQLVSPEEAIKIISG